MINLKNQDPHIKKTWKNLFCGWMSELAAETHSFSRVAPDLGAFILAKIIRKSGKNVIIICPEVSMAERISAFLYEISTTFGLTIRQMQFPEAGDGGQIIPENEILRSKILFQTFETAEKASVICTVKSFLQPLPSPASLEKDIVSLRCGMSFPPDKLLARLVKLDYDDEYEVTAPGEFSRRGGIIDIFSPSCENPVRIEFWGDQIDTMRFFSAETQLSIGPAESISIIPKSFPCDSKTPSNLSDYLGKDCVIVALFPEQCESHLERFASKQQVKNWHGILATSSEAGRLYTLLDEVESDSCPDSALSGCYPSSDHDPRRKENSEMTDELFQQLTAARIRQWIDCGIRTVITGKSEEEVKCALDWCTKHGIPETALELEISPMSIGFFIPSIKLALLTEKELYLTGKLHRFAPPVLNPEKHSPKFFEFQFAELDEGDFVVHGDYGIGIFRGIEEFEENGRRNEMFRMEFADDLVVNIPLWRANSFTRYVGSRKNVPKLSSMGGKKWAATRIQAAKAVKGVALQMLSVQATRIQDKGFRFPDDDQAQYLFEKSFPYNETPDQKKASEEVKSDMASEKPMDRLICGDVGYGKTEVAARAAFKAVSSGRQAAILVPTTVLAQQHFYTFSERFAETPVIIEMLSRFKSTSEQKKILERLAEGKIDILIGTHRIVQSDVVFRNLGLVIIDEEQRFGVDSKEKLKSLRNTVDILAMTATPIPRTLYMAITGIRDLSAIMTPPELRLPIQTIVSRFDDATIAQSINSELERGGQVYYLHNRIQSIEKVCLHLRKLVPDAKFAIAHGRMNDHELEEIMSGFLEGKIDVLVCTTIIQSGIDIPNANTIIIERADRFGLAELYQLRGRVGRWTRQAYAYLLMPEHVILQGNARERIAAIRRYTQLGAGFRLALRDLEIRGAGNLLGHEQSGHINAIGFELYCSLLRNAVAELQGKKNEVIPDISVFVDFLDFAHETHEGKIAASLPPEYIPFEKLRVDFYRRIAKIADPLEFESMGKELEDRFGKIPRQALFLLQFFRIRLNLARNGVISLATNGDEITIKTLPSPKRKNEQYFHFNTKDPVEKLDCLQKISQSVNLFS